MRISKQFINNVILGLINFLVIIPAFASQTAYSIEYSSSSPKGPSLKNTTVTGQTFNGGVPSGFFNARTNASNQFTIDNHDGSRMAIAVYSIEGEGKHHVRCSGNTTPGNYKIILNCSGNSQN